MQSQTTCMPVKETVMDPMGMRNVELPVQCQMEELRQTFTSAPQFQSIHLDDVLILRQSKLRVLVVGENPYYRRQCAMYLATMAEQAGKDEHAVQLDKVASRWQSLEEDDDDDAQADVQMLVAPSTLLDPPPPSHPAEEVSRLQLQQVACTAFCVETVPSQTITSTITNSLLYGFEKSQQPHLFLSITPQQLDSALSKTLQFTHGFVVCHVGEPNQAYLEEVFWHNAQTYFPNLQANPNVSVSEIIDHVRHLQGKDFHQGDLVSAIANTFPLGLAPEDLTTQDFCFTPTALVAKPNGRQALEAMVELENVKTAIRRLLAMDQLNHRRRQAHLPTTPRHRHMAFTGAPGTGKTVCAQLLAQILQEEGEGSGIFVEAGRQDLVGKYLGHTSPQIAALFEKAKGGVLFLDEIGALITQGTAGSDSYTEEAINALVYHLDRNPETIVIFATYPKEMEAFLDSNAGLRSRLAQTIHFPSYHGDTLGHILQSMVTAQGYTMEPAAVERCKAHLLRLKASDPEHFGNGRDVRRLFNATEEEMAVRLTSDAQSPLTITLADVETALTRMTLKTEPVCRTIGFAC